MNFALKGTALFASLLIAGSASAAGSYEEFKAKVAELAKEYNQPVPALAGEDGKAEVKEAGPEEKLKEAVKKVPPIDKIVDMKVSKLRAIADKNGRIMYMADNGRFVIVGKLFDVWERRELKTINEISDAVSRVDLKALGFSADDARAVTVGEGKEVATFFVDPLCSWCHKLIEEVEKSDALKKDYTFKIVVIPALGTRSEELSKAFYCTSETENAKRYEALRKGDEGISSLPVPIDNKCDAEGYKKTLMASQAMGIEAVPFLVAPDGRYARGKPDDLASFLKGGRQ